MNLGESVQLGAFAILALMMLGSALGVVLAGNIVYSAFLLGLTFISMAGLYLLLNADFVAAAQILVYVGAVNVLILFGVMLVNKREDYVPAAGALLRQVVTALVCAGLFALLAAVVLTSPWQLATDFQTVESSIVTLAQHFFSDYLLPFEVASVLLLMAMIGAIVLARRDLLVDDPTTGQPTETELALPERPKELAATDR
ncbi:MAG: NADH-quinone oxidoreductase subunit J [Limnothrix sp. CACIAM 69d]|nr:MAG: NADH-quinone oxidoreductase subunit J [Limnothrix sp. CACIAM 69d]